MSDTYPSRVAEKIVIRLPDGMRDRLAAVAKANKRSVNAEVVARLEASFEVGHQLVTGGIELEEDGDSTSVVIDLMDALKKSLTKLQADRLAIKPSKVRKE